MDFQRACSECAYRNRLHQNYIVRIYLTKGSTVFEIHATKWEVHKDEDFEERLEQLIAMHKKNQFHPIRYLSWSPLHSIVRYETDFSDDALLKLCDKTGNDVWLSYQTTEGFD